MRSNKEFIGRAPVTLDYGRNMGRAPVQWSSARLRLEKNGETLLLEMMIAC